MTDGRKYRPAHRASRKPLVPSGTVSLRRVVPTVAAMTLGLTGVGLVATPANADDLDARIDDARSDVERLDARATERARDRDAVRERAAATEKRVEALTEQIREQRRVAESLRAKVARDVLVEHADGGGSVVPVATDPLPTASEDVLTGVAMVTEDTDGAAQRIAAAKGAVTTLREKRVEVRRALQERREKAEVLEDRAAQASRSASDGRGRLDALEAEKAERAERAAQEKAEEAAASSAVGYAMAQVGKSYVWGASGPSSFDCSGLTMAAWATQGVSLPHNSAAQYAAGTPVSESELQPGDLVFYYSPISHVGIYVGNGQVVNALNPGSGVRVSGLHDMPYSGAVRPG